MKKFFLILFMSMLLLMGMAGATYTAISAVSSLDSQNDYARAPSAWSSLLGNGSVNYYDWPEGYDLIVGFNFTSSYNTTLDYFDIMAGDGAQAFRASIGNYSFDAPTAGVYWFGPLESARFMNSTGYLQISSGYMVGKLAVLKVA
jgi:hypothetical protein